MAGNNKRTGSVQAPKSELPATVSVSTPAAPMAATAIAAVPAAVEVAPVAVAAAVESATAAITNPGKANTATPQPEERTMADTIETVTAKGEQVFNQMKDKAQDAVAKGKAMFGDAGEFGKGNVEALVESGRIAAKGFERLGQDQAEFVRKSFEQTTAAFRSLASVKSPTEFLQLQSDFVRNSFDAMVAQGSHQTEAMVKLAGEIAQPISNRFAVAAEKAKLAA